MVEAEWKEISQALGPVVTVFVPSAGQSFPTSQEFLVTVGFVPSVDQR